MNSEEFLHLNQSQLCKLLQNDELGVRCESYVFKAVIDWVRFDPEKRHKHLDHLITCVRIHLLPPKFLKDQTTSKLVTAFSPKVKSATSKVELTKYWNPIITKYNNAMTLTGGQKLNPDLDAYITQKAIEGLFYMVEKEENKIRKDPVARVTDLLVKVFGSLTN